MKNCSLLLLCLFVAACATGPSPDDLPRPGVVLNSPEWMKANPPAPERGPASFSSSSDENIDEVQLQRELGLNREPEELGYEEKTFDTCAVGYGYSSNSRCRKQVFGVLHFQLLCRDTNGTTLESVTRQAMAPLSLRSVDWTIHDQKGSLNLDSRGYGQIKMISKKSEKTERIRLTLGNDFLSMRVNEINRVVTPKDWCN